jgi:DNA-binding XRE family transcriptional regulator
MTTDPRRTDDTAQQPDGEGAALRQQFGRAVERARVERGWTADEAAKRAGVAPKTWQRIEDGMPVRSLTIAKLDELFGMLHGISFDAYSGNIDPSIAFRSRAMKASVDTRTTDPEPGQIYRQIQEESKKLEDAGVTDEDVRTAMMELVQATRSLRGADEKRDADSAYGDAVKIVERLPLAHLRKLEGVIEATIGHRSQQQEQWRRASSTLISSMASAQTHEELMLSSSTENERDEHMREFEKSQAAVATLVDFMSKLALGFSGYFKSDIGDIMDEL